MNDTETETYTTISEMCAEFDVTPRTLRFYEYKELLQPRRDILRHPHPESVIQLEAHTDSRGGAVANKKLSQDRAETCVNYLQEKGIAAARMVPVGYGEDALLISDAEINRMAAEDREMAHQRNRRTVFKIIRFDYKPGK